MKETSNEHEKLTVSKHNMNDRMVTEDFN